MVDIICALCGQKQQIRILYQSTLKEEAISNSTYSARRLPDKIHYRILKCDRCGLLFSSPIFSAKKVSTFYKESACNYKDKIPYLIKTYSEIIKKINDLPKNPRVLEVGCGNGFFLKALMDLGITKNIFGIEPSSKMVSQAHPSLKNKIKIDVFKPNLFPKESFDLICCFHTLDHMVDPQEFVKGANSMLKKNGYAVVVVHDTEGLSVRMFGENSAIFDIEHIYLFNKKNLREIFLRDNFNVMKVFNIINRYPLNYWIQMSGFPHIIKKYAKLVLDLLGASKKGVSISVGNIALIAKKSI